MGRPTNEERIIKQLTNVPAIQKFTPIATDMFLPNMSQVKRADDKFKSARGYTPGSIIFAGTECFEEANSYLFWDNVNKRLGIGTTTPATKLDIKSAGNGEYIQQWTNSNGNLLGLIVQGSSGDGQFYLADSTGTYHTKIIGAGDSYFNGGNVGIGTTSPAGKLDVNGNAIIRTGGSAGKAMCWKADGITLGYCSSAINASGVCTCN